MNTVFASATVASMDAGVETTWTYSRRVAMVNAEFMSHPAQDPRKAPPLDYFAYSVE